MHSVKPKAKSIVLIGGGHTHALVLRALTMNPVEDAAITLINPSPKAPYTGMLPGYVAGHYDRNDVEIDLVKLARAAGASIILDEVTHIDPSAQKIELRARESISFDFASVNIGITSHLPMISGFNQHGHPAKPLGTFAAGWEAFINRCKSGQSRPNIAVIGGGVAGIELALSMSHRAKTELGTMAKIAVIERSDSILKGTHAKTIEKLRNYLESAEIDVLAGSEPVKITSSQVHLQDSTLIDSEFTVGAAGATPYPWLEKSKLATKAGFIQINKFLKSTTHPNIFAAGDCAYFSPEPLPKAGVFAVRQAPILLKNLRAAIRGNNPTAYRPQKTYLKLISTGPKSAVADKFGISWDGPLLWKWKDHIDRKFMDRLNRPPSMPTNAAPPQSTAPNQLSEKFDMMCGGCGAKMSGQNLSEILLSQPAPTRKDVLSKLGDDAAILKHGDDFQVFTTDHLRTFTNDPWLIGKIAAIHALGDIWAMGAKPQAAVASVILPPMADHLHSEMLTQILDGARPELTDCGAELVGGHTSIGQELTVGFSLTGLMDRMPITNSGARPGDVLVLTKPLGIGTVLAAEMRGLADGYHVRDVYDLMTQGSNRASQILSKSANAMTDVTGFGLAGHLSEMMKASGTSAEINLSDIPMMEAAVHYANKGIRSTLWDANRRALPDFTGGNKAREVLLFDPQTAGGLLASVPKDQSEQILKALQESGEDAAAIGEVHEGPASVNIT